MHLVSFRCAFCCFGPIGLRARKLRQLPRRAASCAKARTARVTAPRKRRPSLDLKKLRILIVGAGVAGLALGRALRPQVCSADIIERNAGWDDAGAGMYLPGNALRALRTLKLDAEVEKRAARIGTQRFSDCRGRLLSETNLGSVWSEAGPCVAVHRADLHAALREGADAIPIRMGITLISLAQSVDSVLAHQRWRAGELRSRRRR